MTSPRTLDQILSAPPFSLDASARDWVRRTKDSMTPREKAGQLFVHLLHGFDPAEEAMIAALKPAGITRGFGPDMQAEAALIDRMQAGAAIPMFISADLEGSRMSLPFGTQVPNPLALAAVDDLAATQEISRIMADEARAIGINWSFTPVLDINAAFRSAIVATRAFGADPATIERHMTAQINAFQGAGVAATAKHWPGEGYDDRDQHLVTTINPLSLDEWEETFGRLYRAAIKADVLAIMSAHIALPAYVLGQNPQAGQAAYCPASMSPVLNNDLLRGRLGFNGLIVSDATPMGGLGSWAPARETQPGVIAAGCDIILFSRDPEDDLAQVEAAIAKGTITPARLDEALTRILGLKAKLGLHLPQPAPDRSRIGNPADIATAKAVTARAPTLVKDVDGVFPVTPAKHRRVLIISGGVVTPFAPDPLPFDLPQMMRDEGFEVTEFTNGMTPDPDQYDLLIYLLGEETLLTRGRIFLDWLSLTGHLGAAMARHWHDIPTAMISFGYPYYLYDAPRVPAYVNAYATMPEMQAATLDCMLGRTPWNLHNPVDPFCGLPDARF